MAKVEYIPNCKDCRRERKAALRTVSTMWVRGSKDAPWRLREATEYGFNRHDRDIAKRAYGPGNYQIIKQQVEVKG